DANAARLKKPANRSEYDKDVLKTDERVSILSGMIGRTYLKIFPKPNDSTNTWYSPDEMVGFNTDDSTLVSGMWKLYVNSVIERVQTGDIGNADRIIELINSYQ